METAIKAAETTKVALKINFSNPLLVKEELELDLAKPEPRGCISTIMTMAIENIICNTNKTFCI